MRLIRGNAAAASLKLVDDGDLRALGLVPFVGQLAPSEDHTPGRLGDHLQAAATRADRRRFSLNRLLVRSAEDTVFFRDDRPWVAGFITKNRHFRVDTEVVKASAPGAPARFRQGIVASYRREARNASVRERGLGTEY
jgi:hypothetical protein